MKKKAAKKPRAARARTWKFRLSGYNVYFGPRKRYSIPLNRWQYALLTSVVDVKEGDDFYVSTKLPKHVAIAELTEIHPEYWRGTDELAREGHIAGAVPMLCNKARTLFNRAKVLFVWAA